MSRLHALHRSLSRHRRKVAWALYAGVTLAAFGVAHLLRFELSIPEDHVRTMLVTAPILLVLRLVSFRMFHLSMERWRHIGVRDVVRLAAAASLGSGSSGPW